MSISEPACSFLKLIDVTTVFLDLREGNKLLHMYTNSENFLSSTDVSNLKHIILLISFTCNTNANGMSNLFIPGYRYFEINSRGVFLNRSSKFYKFLSIKFLLFAM